MATEIAEVRILFIRWCIWESATCEVGLLCSLLCRDENTRKSVVFRQSTGEAGALPNKWLPCLKISSGNQLSWQRWRLATRCIATEKKRATRNGYSK